MENTSLPQELSYSNIKPKGYYTNFKQWPIYPASSNLYWQSNQIVRFLFQLNNGVMDPYRSHLQLQVETNLADLPVGGMVMDLSAQSLINLMIVSSNGREVQRINEYDVLAGMLYDLGFSEWVCQNRQWQGMGFSLRQTQQIKNDIPYCNDNAFLMPTAAGVTTNPFIASQKGFSGCMSPTKTSSSYLSGGTAFIHSSAHNNGNVGPNSFQYLDCTNSGGQVSQHVCSSNILWNKSGITINPLTTTGKLNNIRYQYQPQVTGRNYIDSTSSLVLNNPLLPSGVIPANYLTGATMPSSQSYATYYASNCSIPVIRTSAGTGTQVINVPQTTNLLGYSKPYSAPFSKGMNEPLLSPTIPQCQLSYGKVLSAPIPISKKRFKIPLLSTVLGVLIPVDQFVMIPLKSLMNTLIQLTLNPYGMYSTGCKDVHQFDAVGMQTPIPRKFSISNIQYNLHIYQFPQQQIAAYLQASLTKQIILTGSTWTLASQYQLPTGNSVKNNWQINVSCQSLAQVCCVFLSNDYLKYPYCRKQFRLSNNITSMQLKFNVTYYPPQPITGNAGCPQSVDNTGDNSDFVEQLLVSNNYLFTTNIPQPKINIYNFALNERLYDPSNVSQPLYHMNMAASTDPATYVWSSTSVNGDVPMGQSYFHQNRARGTAIYSYSFQPHNHSKNHMIGVDTRRVRPFDIMFDCSTVNHYPRDQTLYIFCRQHVIVTYGQNGINVLGR